MEADEGYGDGIKEKRVKDRLDFNLLYFNLLTEVRRHFGFSFWGNRKLDGLGLLGKEMSTQNFQ